jgi:hypothetical protein
MATTEVSALADTLNAEHETLVLLRSYDKMRIDELAYQETIKIIAHAVDKLRVIESNFQYRMENVRKQVVHDV